MKRLLWATIKAPASAGAFSLALPVDCVVPRQCFVQNYPDRDPGPAATDFTCAPLSYGGHSGTDFAVPTKADMQRVVVVLAAAPGVVSGLRGGMEDVAQNGPNAPDVSGRECGNGLVIDHQEGWQTQIVSCFLCVRARPLAL